MEQPRDESFWISGTILKKLASSVYFELFINATLRDSHRTSNDSSFSYTFAQNSISERIETTYASTLLATIAGYVQVRDSIRVNLHISLILYLLVARQLCIFVFPRYRIRFNLRRTNILPTHGNNFIYPHDLSVLYLDSLKLE